MRYFPEITHGRATLVPHSDGGWALPGGQRVTGHLEAMAWAAEVDAEMTRLAEHAKRTKTKNAQKRS